MSRSLIRCLIVAVLALLPMLAVADVASQMSAAERGDKDAQYGLYVRYSSGNGVAKDETKAVYWLKRAAESGQPAAMDDYGNRLQQGIGVAQNEGEAIQWYEKAAAKIPMGYLNLATAYQIGRGVERNPQKAAQMYEKYLAAMGERKLDTKAAQAVNGQVAFCRGEYAQALDFYAKSAEAGNEYANYQVSMMYAFGVGTSIDYPQALAYCEKSPKFAKPCAGGLYLLQKKYSATRDVSQALTEDGQFGGWALGMLGHLEFLKAMDSDSPNYSKAAQWFGQAADAKAPTFYGLGFLFRYGLGVPRNPGQALEFFKKTGAPSTVGWMYAQGDGVSTDRRLAEEYFRVAEMQNPESYVEAESGLGWLSEHGTGAERDCQQARAHYETAAHGNNSRGKTGLGHLFETGCGVERDYAKAAEYYRAAVKDRDPDAEYYLSGLYKNGLGVSDKKDVVEAYAWLALSAHDTLEFDDRTAREKERDSFAMTLSKDQRTKAKERATELARANPHYVE